MHTWTTGIVTGRLAGAIILGCLPAWGHPCGSPRDRRQMNQERRLY